MCEHLERLFWSNYFFFDSYSSQREIIFGVISVKWHITYDECISISALSNYIFDKWLIMSNRIHKSIHFYSKIRL